MSSRKKPPASQGSLSLDGPKPAPVTTPTSVQFLVPDATPVVAERKLRLVHSRAKNDVTIEPTDDGRFVVARTRDYGTTVAAVVYTRDELEILLRRIPAALAMGGR